MRRLRRFAAPLLVAPALALAAWVILRNAWLGDDAYISFRVADNLVGGHGLRYNVAERVQVFTNPLWVLLVSAFLLVVRDVYAVALGLSLVLSLATLGLVFRLARGRLLVGLAGVLALVSSRAFVDYATSGLENCLSNALLACFALFFLRASDEPERPPPLAGLLLLGSLLAVNRLDLAVLVLPPLAWMLRRRRSARALGTAAVGLLPLVLWELFALVYYGFPFPNTAYAKLANGLSRAELLGWGLEYLRASAAFDPLACVLLVAAAAAALARRARAEGALLAGGAAYLAYVVWIGGDFMAGRFLVGPLVLAVVALVRLAPAPRPLAAGALAALAALAALDPGGPLRTGPRYYDEPARLKRKLGPRRAVADERSHYFTATNPFLAGDGPWPFPDLARLGGRFRAAGRPEVKRLEMAGAMPYCFGPGLHVVDAFALVDPLLARLPLPEGRRARPGHYERWLPLGYLRTLAEGRDRMVDRDLARYREALATVTRGPLFTAERWRAILALNTGRLDHLIDPWIYRAPDAAEFRRRHEEGPP